MEPSQLTTNAFGCQSDPAVPGVMSKHGLHSGTLKYSAIARIAAEVVSYLYGQYGAETFDVAFEEKITVSGFFWPSMNRW
ncbi:hypothetical protein Poli38472_011367 [Pythium oligandrum]|uniref:Uncharacterized protein n=1 Tax=Pythium oligandrum TaxID=41045 RepID=A0A8K1FM46_PYTOL|nr:hypothetical protein Poli38472_011367 [Pythium oligandrum]|eukprot:TMW64487.1 hypothetical protein Poli38472_011367 [Pythium oligandrum]